MLARCRRTCSASSGASLMLVMLWQIPGGLDARCCWRRSRFPSTTSCCRCGSRCAECEGRLTSMKPIAVHASNPGPMTGDGNWTWLIPGRVPTLIDAGTGEPQHLDALERRARGRDAGAGARDPRAHRSRVRCAGDCAERMPHVRFLQDAVAGARRRVAASAWEPLTDGDRSSPPATQR